MKRTVLALCAAALLFAPSALGSIPRTGCYKLAPKAKLACATENLKHANYVLHFYERHPRLLSSASRKARAWKAVEAHQWLKKAALRDIASARAALTPKPVDAAAAWYARGDTQCEVSHEGTFDDDRNAKYKGRFQMDYDFETSTPFGRSMEARYGRANNWPAWAQIQHAYEVWLVRGWQPWPPYYVFGCAAYIGRSYP